MIDTPTYGDERLSQRFWSKVSPEPLTGCWLWAAADDGAGYGVYGVGTGRIAKAHRVAYLAMVGAIPDGLELDHLCRVRCCVNPEHLEPVTRRENVRRSPLAMNKDGGQTNRAKTHCPKGHAFDEENTLLAHKTNPNGRETVARRCKACVYEQNKASAQRRAARNHQLNN